jgi:hypothetical protein
MGSGEAKVPLHRLERREMDDVDYLTALLNDVKKYPSGIQEVTPGRLQDRLPWR